VTNYILIRIAWAAGLFTVGLLVHQTWEFFAHGHAHQLLPAPPTDRQRWARALVTDARVLGTVHRDGVEVVAPDEEGEAWFVRRLDQDGSFRVSERAVERVLAERFAPREQA